jgi:hypothetical protein
MSEMSATNSKNSLLRVLLECDRESLRMIENVNYEWLVIDRRCRSAYEESLLDVLQDKDRGKNGLDRMLYAVIDFGLSQIKEAVDFQIEWSETGPGALVSLVCSPDVVDAVEGDLKQLRSLNPFDDIRFEIDGLNTCVWFEKNEELYQKYVPGVIREVECCTGLKIQDCDCGKYYV